MTGFINQLVIGNLIIQSHLVVAFFKKLNFRIRTNRSVCFQIVRVDRPSCGSAKINFPFKERWLLIIMLLMIVPMETIITIHFLFIAKLGLLNTVIGYVLPMIVNPFNIFLFRQVFISLPDDVYEAAQLDFCSPVKYFFTMVLPMSKSVVATVSVFTFLNVWNDYLWPSLVFTSSDLLTAQIGLNAITSNDNTTMGQTLAVITMITIPVIIIYSLFSKQIVEGVVSTGSKEG